MRQQLLSLNDCVIALDKAFHLASQSYELSLALAMVRSVRRDYAQRRDALMVSLSTLEGASEHA